MTPISILASVVQLLEYILDAIRFAVSLPANSHPRKAIIGNRIGIGDKWLLESLNSLRSYLQLFTVGHR
jgi:hypothetical protein